MHAASRHQISNGASLKRLIQAPDGGQSIHSHRHSHSFSQRAVIPSIMVNNATSVPLIGSSRSLVSISALYVYGVDGANGTGGTIVLQSCLTEQGTTPPALDLSGGSSGSGSGGGMAGANGNFTLLWSDIGSATNCSGGFARMSLIGSTFYSSDSYV